MAVNDGDIITQVITFTLGSGDQFQNKFTWEYDGDSYADSSFIGGMDSWAEDFYELMATYLASGMTSFTSEYNKITWNDVDDIWEISYNIGVGSGNVTFTDANDLLPYQCCPCLVGFTSRPKTRGRKFIPLFCEDAQSNSSWVAGADTVLAAALAEYLATHIFETGKAVFPGVASTVTGTFLQFLSGLITDIVFTQRRRTLGRGA